MGSVAAGHLTEESFCVRETEIHPLGRRTLYRDVVFVLYVGLWGEGPSCSGWINGPWRRYLAGSPQ